jgi:CheY-like chemotaxis protein
MVDGEELIVLLIEDNPDHAELVMRGFEDFNMGNKIYHAVDGEQALDYLFRRGEYSDPALSPKPHLILLDLRLPKVDGIEVLKEIKASPALRCIPVVVLTTSEAENDLLGAYDCFVNSYLVKPLDFQKFSRLIADLGFYWLAWNRKPDSRACPNIKGAGDRHD